MKSTDPHIEQHETAIVFIICISSSDELLCLASYHSCIVEEINAWDNEIGSVDFSHERYFKDPPQWEDRLSDLFMCLAVGAFRNELTDRQAQR
jgi:hypothetical protein